jgi:hypothetical protein
MNLTQLIDIKERIAVGEHLNREQRDFVLQCINEAVGLGRSDVVTKPPNFLPRIESIWAYLCIDDGGEGVIGWRGIPLIAADKARLDSLRPVAVSSARMFHCPVRLAQFTTREDIETITP